jgi:hypothetical protein
MDRRARACLGLRTAVERRDMARRSGAPGALADATSRHGDTTSSTGTV